MRPSGSIALIVPCFNEAQRLNTAAFREFADKYQFYFVDDGSTDGTSDFLRRELPNSLVLTLAKNQGKAEAVRQGMMAALKDFPEAKWIGFWDADLATPLFEVENMLRYRDQFFPKAQAIFGSRVAKLGSVIHRSPVRHYLGRLFATALDLIIGVRPYDSQCGAKLFHRTLVDQAFGEPFLSRWIFDVEILLRLPGGIIEYPLAEWRDIPGSKIRIGREAIRVFRDMLRIRRHYLPSSARHRGILKH